MDLIKLLRFPIFFACIALCSAGYSAWKESKVQDELVELSLKGNPAAIGILQKYEKPWKLDERLMNEAIAGNQNAIEALGIQSK